MDNVETVQVLDSTCQIEEHRARVSLGVFVRRDDHIKEIAPLEKECYVMQLGINTNL